MITEAWQRDVELLPGYLMRVRALDHDERMALIAMSDSEVRDTVVAMGLTQPDTGWAEDSNSALAAVRSLPEWCRISLFSTISDLTFIRQRRDMRARVALLMAERRMWS